MRTVLAINVIATLLLSASPVKGGQLVASGEREIPAHTCEAVIKSMAKDARADRSVIVIERSGPPSTRLIGVQKTFEVTCDAGLMIVRGWTTDSQEYASR